jgi:NAD(P)-dependent dehydrogenase (short-subunit alcohol dehydrogenase family)
MKTVSLTFFPQSAEAAKAVVAEIIKSGGEAHAFQADISVRSQVFGLVDEVIKRWGHLDILVNNSAIVLPWKTLEDETEEQVDRLLEVNYKGTLWGIQAAAKVLKSGGSIINISSIAARLGAPVRHQSPTSRYRGAHF